MRTACSRSILLVLLVAAGCGSSGASTCVQGASVACACTNGQTGAQLCNADGVLGRCSCEAAGDGGGTGDGGLPGASDGPLAPPRPLDLLFMIDNSPSTGEAQNNIRRNFSHLMSELRLRGDLDLHVGVVSSDLGAGTVRLPNGGCPNVGGNRGVLQTGSTCGLQNGSRFLNSSSGGTTQNFSGTIEAAFSCIANLGTAGCGYEHQLQSVRVALSAPENAGFLRPNAVLAIVLLTDEDDCSAPLDTTLFVDDASFMGTSASFRCAQVGHLCNGQQPPVGSFSAPLASCSANPGGPLIKITELVDGIKAVKTDPTQVLVWGIFGWPKDLASAVYSYSDSGRNGLDYRTSCSSSNGEATAGLRLKAFVDAFGAQGGFFSICQDDLGGSMSQIGRALAAHL
jgi:hypothetical protein